MEEHLDAHGISHAEFTRQFGFTAKLFGEIISGKVLVDPATALRFKTVLGVHAGIWLGIEKDHQCYRQQQTRAKVPVAETLAGQEGDRKVNPPIPVERRDWVC